MQIRLSRLPTWPAGKPSALHSSSLSQKQYLMFVSGASLGHLNIHSLTGRSSWCSFWQKIVYRARFDGRCHSPSGSNWVRLGRIFIHLKVDKMRVLSPRVQARLETPAGCHYVWFQMHDCNSTRQRCVFPKASQAICRGVYRSCACLWYMPSTTHTHTTRQVHLWMQI